MNAFEQFKDLIQSINLDPVIILGVVSIVGTFIIEIILIHTGILNFGGNNKKKMEKAIKLNHQIKAKRISYYDDDITGTEVNSWYHAKYEYTVNGRKKKYRYLSRKYPPTILNLYYISNPNKVFHYEEKNSILVLLIYIIPIIVGYVVMTLLGFK